MRLSIRAYDVIIQVNLQFSLFIFGRRTTVRPVATQLPFFGLQHPVRDRGMVHGGTAQRTVATTSLIVLCMCIPQPLLPLPSPRYMHQYSLHVRAALVLQFEYLLSHATPVYCLFLEARVRRVDCFPNSSLYPMVTLQCSRLPSPNLYAANVCTFDTRHHISKGPIATRLCSTLKSSRGCGSVKT